MRDRTGKMLELEDGGQMACLREVESFMEYSAKNLGGNTAGGIFHNGVLERFSPCTRRLLSRLFRLDRFSSLYKRVMIEDQQANILDRILGVLDIAFDASQANIERIPRHGSVLVVANHPFGGIEGLILGSLLRSVRSDSKVMANHLLGILNIREFSDHFIYVDPFGGRESIKTNVRPVRESIQWLKQGGMLGLFPAGEVSHFHMKQREITDPQWSENVARIIRKSGAPVLPVFFCGCNSLAFQMLGVLHPKLRTIMLPREMLNKRRHKVQLTVGKVIPLQRLLKLKDDRSMMEYLRVKTYMLGSRGREENKRSKGKAVHLTSSYEPIAGPQSADLLADEVRALPPGQLLVDTGKYMAFWAESRQIPNLLHEIGRLREMTFRMAGEGTGKSVDLDRFDRYYLHLFLWNRETAEIVGGYRIGQTDSILGKYGKAGLYTSTLFEYQAEFLDRVNPALELGRSFVCPAYQKNYQPLMLLWRGIGRFIVERPRYRMLFGPVSVSDDYHAISRQLIVAFSRKNCYRADLARYVKGNCSHLNLLKSEKNIKTASVLLENIQELSELICEIERDERGIPILLKHYLKLGGESLAFSMDHDFSRVMDVLILVDLVRTSPAMLERYMGKSGAESFLDHHHVSSLADCA